MKSSTYFQILGLYLGALLVVPFFEIGTERLFKDYGTLLLAVLICAATATILREIGR